MTMRHAYERPFRPAEITGDSAVFFPLLRMAEQLMAEDAFDTAGRNTLTLARGHNATVVLITLKEQAVLKEHTAPGPITVTALSGRLEFSTASQPGPFELQAGDAAICAPGLPHRVKALENSAFLVVIGGRAD